MDQLKRDKGHDPDRERTYNWSRQLGHFTTKKNEIQKSVPRERSPFLLGPVKSEILLVEWPNGSRQLC